MPQKTVFGSDTNLHGICLDVQLEETLDGTTVYNIEPEMDSRLKSVKSLPRRARFYHAKMSSRGLKSGEDYGALTLFFYTKVKEGIPSEEIKQLLTYMEDSSKKNVMNEFL